MRAGRLGYGTGASRSSLNQIPSPINPGRTFSKHSSQKSFHSGSSISLPFFRPLFSSDPLWQINQADHIVLYSHSANSLLPASP